MIDRRGFVRLLAGAPISAALPMMSGCSTAMPPEAIAAWQGPSSESELRTWLLSYAILAPHSHNLQSWLVNLDTPGEITLYCDLERLLPETDPLSRQIMLSQGTFLELLVIAARERGHRAEVSLFPQGEFDANKPDRRPTAHIRLTEDSTVEKDPLFAQILKRRTNREEYQPRAILRSAIDAITTSVSEYSVRVGCIDFDSQDSVDLLGKHRAIAAEAWRIELVTPRTVMESYHVLRVGPDEIAKHRDGISVNNRLPRVLLSLGLFDRSKAPGPDDAAVKTQISDFDDKLSSTRAFFWMVTEGNDRRMQINAGRAYVRAQLAATAAGLSMHPLSQALQEYPEQAKPYADIHALLDAPPPRFTVQMWTRLGFAPPIEPAPRRALAEHFVSARNGNGGRL